ncbi:hypothetical protein V6N13_093389 [Hibiscus sabdariffa]|uniref:Secreted protein n=2 Tax=Hibiscus sabdariffa TaxID=183260 RepID=A0ABR2N8D8_9ROSI
MYSTILVIPFYPGIVSRLPWTFPLLACSFRDDAILTTAATSPSSFNTSNATNREQDDIDLPGSIAAFNDCWAGQRLCVFATIRDRTAPHSPQPTS